MTGFATTRVLSLLVLSCCAASALARGGIFDHHHGGGCTSCSKCRHHRDCDCCTETIVIHCDRKGEQTGTGFSDTAGTVGGSTLIQPTYGYSMMPMMPMFGGVMPMAAGSVGNQGTGFRDTSAQLPRAGCDDSYKLRIENLEKEFKELSSQVDRVVNAVDRNTTILESIVEKMKTMHPREFAQPAQPPADPTPAQ